MSQNSDQKENSLDKEQLKANLISGAFWLRFLHMLVVGVVTYVLLYVIVVVVVIQFFFALVTREDNPHLRSFAKSLCIYIAQSARFMTFVSDFYPFPFSEWPSEDDKKSE